MSRRALPALVALLAWAATACHVTIAAGVDVARDGSGRVTAGLGLDADALTELGDPAAALRVDDLRGAGWQVEGPRKEDDGLTWVRASKPFADPEQAAATMAELSGPDGPFREFRVVRTRSLTRSRTTFTGTVDLSRGLAGLSDPELAAALGDVDPGLDLEGLRRRFGDALARTVTVQVSAGLPGDVTTNAPGRDGGRAVWSPELGQTVRMEASSEALRVDPATTIAAGAVLVVVVAALVVVVRRRRRRRAA
ncbi:MAG TPA: hypothetical protein VHF27_10095 [Acidimicrobiales bacterium]|nr:hypothetical protein [Acidimicrobiales bacterium]